VTASTYARCLHDYRIAVRAYGMSEAMAERSDELRTWAMELRRCALKARDAAQTLANADLPSAVGLGWLEEAAYWDRLAPQEGARRRDYYAPLHR
jgi:hypothetical protein